MSSSPGAPPLGPNIPQSDLLEELIEQYQSFSQKPLEPNPSPSTSSFPSLKSLPILRSILPGKDERHLLIESLLEQQKRCTSYKKWYEISFKLDELLNNNSWKSNPESDFYDYDLIYKNLMEMRNARLSNDYKLLLYVIRTKWIRNLGNMGDINLYRHSYVGTKKLIEEYINECQIALDYLIHDPRVNLEDSYLLGMLIQTRRNIGRTALVLSGGSTFGIFHIGVLLTLLEANLLPRIISGSSAGSIVASILCSHTNEETPELLGGITSKTFNIFGSDEDEPDQKPAAGPHRKFKKLLRSLSHLIKYGTLFDSSGLKNTMIDFLGDLTFREAYNRTGKILNITVSPASIHEQTRLLNYLTAPNCLIWSAVCASCSLPGFFPSNSIYEKTPRTNEVHEWNNDESMKYVDGSVDNDLPITRLSEMFNVDNIIAVQVNPHVVPILKMSVGSIGGEIENHLSSKFKNFLNNVYDFMSCELIHYLQLLNEMDIYKNLSNKLISILSQNYSGDITILADFKSSDFANVFENPTPAFLIDFIVRGARASWPKITVINNYCGVEFALDKAISLLRGRLITTVRHTSKHKKSVSEDKVLANKDDKNYHTLVNSPVLNEDSGVFASTPERLKKVHPTFKRHNTSYDITKKRNSTAGLTFNHSNSWNQGTTKPKKKFTKGKSTTSLTSLGIPINSPLSDDSTLINDDEPKEEKFVRSNSMDHKKYGRRNIKKAKSSSNFFGNETSKTGNRSPIRTRSQKFQSDRVPSFISNPYWDNFPVTRSPKKTAGTGSKDKPNLPKVSANNSSRNSYVGLSRLKGADLNDSPINKGSSSPDRRRSNSTRGQPTSYYFNSIDNDDDLVEWAFEKASLQIDDISDTEEGDTEVDSKENLVDDNEDNNEDDNNDDNEDDEEDDIDDGEDNNDNYEKDSEVLESESDEKASATVKPTGEQNISDGTSDEDIETDNNSVQSSMSKLSIKRVSESPDANYEADKEVGSPAPA